LTAQAAGRQMAAQAQWQAEAEKKMRVALEPLKVQLARAEEERDQARQSASENIRQLHNLEKKLNEASTFLNGWRNGTTVVGAA
jgi:hypothetical protein